MSEVVLDIFRIVGAGLLFVVAVFLLEFAGRALGGGKDE